jgi:hypothetical protein
MMCDQSRENAASNNAMKSSKEEHHITQNRCAAILGFVAYFVP